MKETIFTGAAVALVTPFNPDMSVNYEELEKLIEFQITSGTDAIVTCGTTGEAATTPWSSPKKQKHSAQTAFCLSRRTTTRLPSAASLQASTALRAV